MVAKRKVVMFNKVAEWLEQSVEEILLYYAFPGVYWRRIPACDLLEQKHERNLSPDLRGQRFLLSDD